MSSTSQSQVPGSGSQKHKDMINNSIRYLIDLPNQIIVEILSRLPIKTVLACRCVCKTWLNLISDPHFAKLHFTRSPVELLLQPFRKSTLYLADLDNNLNNTQTEFSTKLYLPTHEPKSKLDTRKNIAEFRIVNSCNGFLCLSYLPDEEDFVIFNPITGEFIRIPDAKKVRYQTFVLSGFGYCEKTNEYKVVRRIPAEYGGGWIAEVHTFGTASWRRIELTPVPWPSWSKSVVFSNGCIHWVGSHKDWTHLINKFDCEKEDFGVIPPPPPSATAPIEEVCLGELRKCLCCSLVSYRGRFTEIWVMKDYGMQDSWAREYVISEKCDPFYRPIKYLNNGDLLMFHAWNSLVTYNHATGGSKYQEVHGVESNFLAVAHIPSLVSLKDAIIGDMVVQVIKSRGAESYLTEKTKAIRLVENTGNHVDVRYLLGKNSDERDNGAVADVEVLN